ncbi:MAG: DUF3592 domain-containing protein [Mucilaginibacter sp.]|uniref:DUF3592 domain-containing protein n=1 Tax=Mucilaginibacter sp. TaxID=1882438 RepID=UPI0031A91ED2
MDYSDFLIYIPTVVSFFIIVRGLVKLANYNLLMKSGLKAEGVIHELVIKHFKGGSSVWPVVKYTTINHEIITKKVDFSADTYSQYEEGDLVTVFYREMEQENFIIDDSGYKKAVYQYILLGILFLAFGLVLLLCKWNNLFG